MTDELDYGKHLANVYKLRREFTCSFCDKTNTESDDLFIVRDQGAPNIPVICTSCLTLSNARVASLLGASPAIVRLT